MPAAFSRMNFNKCFEVGGAETFTLPLGINDSRQSDMIVVYETYDTANENALWQVQLDTAKRIGQTTQRILNDKLASCCLQDVADVVRELYHLKSVKALSFSQRRLFDTGIGLIVQELSISLKRPVSEIEEEIRTMFS